MGAKEEERAKPWAKPKARKAKLNTETRTTPTVLTEQRASKRGSPRSPSSRSRSGHVKVLNLRDLTSLLQQ